LWCKDEDLTVLEATFVGLDQVLVDLRKDLPNAGIDFPPSEPYKSGEKQEPSIPWLHELQSLRFYFIADDTNPKLNLLAQNRAADLCKKFLKLLEEDPPKISDQEQTIIREQFQASPTLRSIMKDIVSSLTNCRISQELDRKLQGQAQAYGMF
jgi:hypothetical protein